MQIRSIFFALLFLFFGTSIFAQKVDLSLRFNTQTATYEVFAKPDFTKSEFLIGAGSQVTVVIPADFQDQPLAVQSFTDGKWIDQSPIYAPKELENRDLHTFISEGGVLNFAAGEELKLFSFALPLSYDHKKVRLFINKKDPTKTGAKNLGHFIANDLSLTDFYRQNYNIVKDIKGYIKDWRGYPIEGVNIKVGTQSTVSLYDGRFAYENVLVEDEIDFAFEKNIAAKAGISTADLIRLQQHLSGEKLFDQPYQWIAADMNHSGTITYDDLALLKQVLNGENSLAGWQFMIADDYAKAAKDLQPFNEIVSTFQAERIFAVDFIGVKMGDVDGSYTIDPQTPNDILPSPKTLTINLLNK
ncbi:MAG: hypothetical protein AAGJ18_13870, partial [Bacteroidota bacterium]